MDAGQEPGFRQVSHLCSVTRRYIQILRTHLSEPTRSTLPRLDLDPFMSQAEHCHFYERLNLRPLQSCTVAEVPHRWVVSCASRSGDAADVSDAGCCDVLRPFDREPAFCVCAHVKSGCSRCGRCSCSVAMSHLVRVVSSSCSNLIT